MTKRLITLVNFHMLMRFITNPNPWHYIVDFSTIAQDPAISFIGLRSRKLNNLDCSCCGSLVFHQGPSCRVEVSRFRRATLMYSLCVADVASYAHPSTVFQFAVHVYIRVVGVNIPIESQRDRHVGIQWF